MTKIILILSSIFLFNFSLLNASQHHDSEHNVTDGHKHSHGIYKKIDDLDKRKTVRKKSLDREHLLNIAKEKVKQLVIDKKISKTWLKAYEPVIAKTKYKFINDWMVVFHNPHIKSEKHKNLYIFVDAFGDIKGANYSGR